MDASVGASAAASRRISGNTQMKAWARHCSYQSLLADAKAKSDADSRLDRYPQVEATAANPPTLRLMGKRLPRAKSLFTGLRLLWFRAAAEMGIMAIGCKARPSETYSKVLDPTAGYAASRMIEQTDRDMMTKITYRALNKFKPSRRTRLAANSPVTNL